MWPQDVNDIMHWKHAQRILGFWKKSVSGVLTSEEYGWLSELTKDLQRVSHVVWGRWKSRHRKIVPLSSLCQKTFKLKGNKKFRTWTKKSSSVFRVWEFLCYLCMSYEHSMYISHIRILGMLQFDSCFVRAMFLLYSAYGGKEKTNTGWKF